MSKQLFVRRDCDGVIILQLLDRELSDLVLQDRLMVELINFVDTHHPRKLLLDLSEVDYCATGVINTFLHVRNHVLEQGGEFRLCCLTESLLIAFRSLNLDSTVFSIHASLDESIAAFNESTQAKP